MNLIQDIGPANMQHRWPRQQHCLGAAWLCFMLYQPAAPHTTCWIRCILMSLISTPQALPPSHSANGQVKYQALTYSCTHTQALTRTHTLTHTHNTHARTHSLTHKHTHKHTQKRLVSLLVFYHAAYKRKGAQVLKCMISLRKHIEEALGRSPCFCIPVANSHVISSNRNVHASNADKLPEHVLRSVICFN